MVVGGPVSQPSFEDGLREIGLKGEWIRTAVGDGNRERTRVLGGQNARSAQGFYAWNGILASLTVTVQSFGWERQDPLSLPILIERNKKNILFISSGNEHTGRIVARTVPRSRNPKGDIVAALARQNKQLLGDGPTLFPDIPLDAQAAAKQEFMETLLGCTTYVLLVHFSRGDLEARYEVSRLGDMSGGRLSVQHPRWIAPAYPLTAKDFGPDDPNEGFDGPGPFPVPPKG